MPLKITFWRAFPKVILGELKWSFRHKDTISTGKVMDLFR